MERRIAAYEKQFELLEAQLYKVEAENARLKAKIKVLEAAKPGAAVQAMTDEELEAQLAPLIEQMGYVKKES
ncbi:hypothetical protein [Ramlibacter alkalitolerans]|uniref:Uncharacterized protein n=1 Tax=Ramlibacter alkalitolerans TaxID=2039631 RepID=A0ABS1JYT8_9BURK|nr:hypothetical protein [Ramlibacter alkalitolerans]MBL0428490.1 hypothetical protein [Ramlibacter alkalitolerans]